VASNNLATLLESASSQIEVLAALASTLSRSEIEAVAVLLVNGGEDFTSGNGALVLTIIYMVVEL
jgi:hypothetical protein